MYFVSGHKENPDYQQKLHLRPYLGSYENFAELPKFSEDWQSLTKRALGGMLDDVIQYWQHSVPSWFDPERPTIQSLAYYPLQIVAAEWVKYTQVMHSCIKRFEYRGSQLPTLCEFSSDLQELQSWRRRSIRSQEKCQAIIRRLRTCQSPNADHHAAMKTLIDDFEVICNNVKVAGCILENMLPVVTSLVQIIDARQSFAETVNISRLTILALIFVPLSFVSSLFGMNPINMPGGPRFWVYFTIAVPVTLLVFLVARPPTAIRNHFVPWMCDRMERKNDSPSDA
jgi:hypothetical protein